MLPMRDLGFVEEKAGYNHPALGITVFKMNGPSYGRPWAVEMPNGNLLMRTGHTVYRFLGPSVAARIALKAYGRSVTRADLYRLGFTQDGYGWMCDRHGLFINREGDGARPWVAGRKRKPALFLCNGSGARSKFSSAERALGALIAYGWFSEQ
jgi:hypothetical protein